jgi:hypothetical protein
LPGTIFGVLLLHSIVGLKHLLRQLDSIQTNCWGSGFIFDQLAEVSLLLAGKISGMGAYKVGKIWKEAL